MVKAKKVRPKASSNLYPHPFSAAYWRDAAYQLFDTRMLCIAAIITALRIAVKAFSIPVGQNLDVTFGFFVNALGSMIYGPVMGLVSGAISDTLGAILFPEGAYFFPWIFVEMAGSLIFALWLWRAKLSTARIILSRFSVTLICNLLMTPLVMIWNYAWINNGKSYKFITIPRLVKNLTLFPVESFLLVLFLGALIPALVKLGMIDRSQTKPVFTKKHIALLVVLFLIALVVVVVYYQVYLPNK